MAIGDVTLAPAAASSVEGWSALADQAVALASAARREILIVSSDLQAQLYDQEPFLLELRRLAISSRRARIQVLVGDVDGIIKRGHRLLELATRLPSFIEIRRLAAEDAQYKPCFLLVDQTSYLWLATSMGEVCAQTSTKGRLLAAEFLEFWERATPDPNLRRLAL